MKIKGKTKLKKKNNKSNKIKKKGITAPKRGKKWRNENREEMKQRELTAILCLIWAVTLLYGEMVAYWLPSLWSCSWPHLNSPNSTVSFYSFFFGVFKTSFSDLGLLY